MCVCVCVNVCVVVGVGVRLPVVAGRCVNVCVRCVWVFCGFAGFCCDVCVCVCVWV